MWQIGDRAIVVKSERLPEMLGEEVSVVGIHSDIGGIEVDIPAAGDCRSGSVMGGLLYTPGALKPIPDNYDGLTISSWDECPIEFHPSRFPEKVTV